MDVWNLVFVHIEVGPDGGEIGDRIQLRFGSHRGLRKRFSVGYKPCDRRVENQVLSDLTGFIELLDLLVADVPQLEAVARSPEQ